MFLSSGARCLATSASLPCIDVKPSTLIFALVGVESKINLYFSLIPVSLFSTSSMDTSMLYFSKDMPLFNLLTVSDAISTFGLIIFLRLRSRLKALSVSH